MLKRHIQDFKRKLIWNLDELISQGSCSVMPKKATQNIQKVVPLSFVNLSKSHMRIFIMPQKPGKNFEKNPLNTAGGVDYTNFILYSIKDS